MPTTAQLLADYPDILLQVLAELRGAMLDGANSRQQAIELLSAQITDPTSVQFAYQEALDLSDQAKEALDLLIETGGELAEADFSRKFGSIRQMGPAKLERESPWLYPESTAELLYYYGLIGRGFKGAGQNAHTIVYIPSDVAPWLPRPHHGGPEAGLPVQPAAPPPASRTILADDSFLEDAGTLLGFFHAEQMRLASTGPHPEDVDRLVQRLQLPFDDSMPEQNVRLALLLHLANRLGWLRRSETGLIVLTGNQVRAFLEKTRAEQRQAFFDAWRNSPDWNDLCRTPGLECSERSLWKNDPFQTRSTVLDLLGRLHPGAWYKISTVIAAIKEAEPHFQRSGGQYDAWYIRSSTTQEPLTGFEQWDAVEGALLRFLIKGPLSWLGAVDLAEPSAGDDWLMSLSQWGARWLGHDTPQPHETIRRAIQVRDDFTVTLPIGAPLDDRFRVERFAQWQASYPQFVYQINQRSLKRAADAGISSQQIAEFLAARNRQTPERVLTALARAGKNERKPVE
jgi:hypothetical protein